LSNRRTASRTRADHRFVLQQQVEKNVLLPAPFPVHRLDRAHFDWRGRERSVLALLAWEAYRDPLTTLCHVELESIGILLVAQRNLLPFFRPLLDLPYPLRASRSCGLGIVIVILIILLLMGRI
jgi:hypothetical protein